MCRTHKNRPAFTIVELMVVLAIVMIALSLAMPAIQRARQFAREVSCKNNLQQLGLAMHNYHDVYSLYPPAWCARFSDADSPGWLGWQWRLLPFVEQANLYSQVHNGLNVPEWMDKPEFAKTVLPIYLCPMDSTGGKNPFRGGFGTSNYSGNFGPELLPRWYESSAEEFWPGAVPTPKDSTGIFRHNLCTRLADITDGISNTGMISERSATSGAGIWIGVRSNRHENDVVTDMNHMSGLNKSWSGFSGRHDGSLNILLCDGAVRLVRDNIDSRPDGTGLLQRLSSKSDGNVVGDF